MPKRKLPSFVFVGLLCTSPLLLADGAQAPGAGTGAAPPSAPDGPMTGGPDMMPGPGMMRRGMMMGNRGMGPGMMMPGDPVANAEKRLSALHSALAITPEQESAWSSYAEAARAQAGMISAHRKARNSGQRVTPEEIMSMRRQGMAQREKILQARQGLFSVLTPAQQQALRSFAMGGMRP